MGQGTSSNTTSSKENRSSPHTNLQQQDAQPNQRSRSQPQDVPGSPSGSSEVQKPSFVFLVSPNQGHAPTQPRGTPGTETSPGNAQGLPPSKKTVKVPTVFQWAHGGTNVYITGTFNDWKERIPLNRSQEEFATILDLEPGTTHQYKFIVDNEWRFNPDMPTVPDRAGATNNFLEVGEPDTIDFDDFYSPVHGSPPGSYGTFIPKMDSSTKEPPILPPHLMQILLNSEPACPVDSAILPVPNHVMLNHLYARTISNGIMVLGGTSRYES
eukprot:Ihof_evm10s39 gene=Ihof_evmTU10s39